MFTIINKNNSMFYFLALVLMACTEKKIVPEIVPAQPIVDKNWQFEATPVWQDDFSTGSTVDASKWTFETGGNGNLSITAKKEALSGREYTSTRMITKGKGDWLYGRFEVRAKLPKGRGTWPAIWMLSSDNSYGTWPASGEIDIMEHVGYDPNKIHSSVHTSAYNHTRNTQKTSSKVIPDATDAFHVYRVDWTPYAIRSYIDGVMYFEFTNEGKGFTAWPFDKKQFMILNIAVGGNWGGVQGVDNTVFPATMEVDYVKVYKMIP
jgi:beta-glucanase (GH16 family)